MKGNHEVLALSSLGPPWSSTAHTMRTHAMHTLSCHCQSPSLVCARDTCDGPCKRAVLQNTPCSVRVPSQPSWPCTPVRIGVRACDCVLSVLPVLPVHVVLILFVEWSRLTIFVHQIFVEACRGSETGANELHPLTGIVFKATKESSCVVDCVIEGRYA